jgi:hypothetical protein
LAQNERTEVLRNLEVRAMLSRDPIDAESAK